MKKIIIILTALTILLYGCTDEEKKSINSMLDESLESSEGEISLPDPIDENDYETNVPELPDSDTGRGDVGDTGEDGGSWTLPEWGEEDVTGEAGGYVELQPGP